MRGIASAALFVALALAPLAGPATGWARDPGTLEAQATDSPASVRVEGSPSSDESVDVRVEAGDRSATLHLRETLAGPAGSVPAGDRVREASPTGPVDARMHLEAGPRVLDGSGRLSPAFPLKARVTTHADDRVDEAWLRVGGGREAGLSLAGEADGRRVYVGRLPAGSLPADRSTPVGAVFERQPTPATAQRLEGPEFEVLGDDEGPPAPDVYVEDERVRVRGPGDGFRAQTRTANGSWQPAAVDNGTVAVPSAPPEREVRARGVDGLGNEGPWSSPVEAPNGSESRPAPGGDWRLTRPEDGARVSGAVEVAWRPANSTARVLVDARPDPVLAWREVGQDDRPSVVWQTRFVSDGDWQLRVRAHVDGNWTSRLLEVTVDNLDPTHAGASTRTQAQPSQPGHLGPRTTSPLPRAMASAAALLALAGGAWRACTRRPK